MSTIVLFDDQNSDQFYPFTLTRSMSDIRMGILTARERLEKITRSAVFVKCENSLIQQRYPRPPQSEDFLFINARTIMDEELYNSCAQLNIGEGIQTQDNYLIAYRSARFNEPATNITTVEIEPLRIRAIWDIFQLNDKALSLDFEQITKGKNSEKLSSDNRLIGSEDKLFIEPGAVVHASIINTEAGPVYIGKDAEIMEGSMIRGGLALCEHAVVKMGAKIYGATTVGPSSKVGGEVNNSVIFGFSNKGHDGFLGNSVIGEWCNLGADTNNSNLKNNYGNVKVWSRSQQDYIDSGLQFCGLFMGDHAKTGINTMLNTGTVIGVSANVFGAGFPDKHLPSFSWGDAHTRYDFEKACQTAQAMMQRRGVELSKAEKEILKAIFEEAAGSNL